MPLAQPLPRKYLSQLQEIQSELRILAHRARRVIEQLEAPQRSPSRVQSLLQEIETGAYRVALEISEIKVADHCGSCPCAPASTQAQIHLLVLADELDRQAMFARQRAKESVTPIQNDTERELVWNLVQQATMVEAKEQNLPN